MGTLLLCSHGLASAPYYLESMALNIYSIEELCYYLKQNIDLVEPSFMEEELIDWIRMELKLPVLAERLEKLKSERLLFAFVSAIAESCNYCTKEEIEQMRKALTDFENKSEIECRKIRADRLLSKKRYRLSILEYKKLLAHPEVSGHLSGNILHNLGTAYAGLFLFSEAFICYKAAYQKNNHPISQKHMQLAEQFSKGVIPQADHREQTKFQMPADVLKEWKEAYIRSCK